MARSNGDLEGVRAAQFTSDRFGATEQAVAADSPVAFHFFSLQPGFACPLLPQFSASLVLDATLPLSSDALPFLDPVSLCTSQHWRDFA